MLGIGDVRADALWETGQRLWRIGVPDRSAAEFAARFEDGAARVEAASAAGTVAPGLHGTARPEMEIAFEVGGPPAFGALFSFKLLDATQTGPQAAVLVNGRMCGLIQLWGTAPSPLPYTWRKTYSLYLPANAFRKGTNLLTLRLVPPMWSEPSREVMERFWFKTDFMELAELDAPPREPVHGAVTYMGTAFKQNDRSFDVNERTERLIDAAMPWLGVAYCGNTMRADFWYDTTRFQPRRREVLERFRDYNATVLVDYIGGHFKAGPDGVLDEKGQAAFRAFFGELGGLVQYYELGNEPCMFWGAYADYLATARYLHSHRPAHLLLAAPGWAYGGGKGEPVNWDADARRRRAVESWCDMTGGHSYGWSYNEKRGGSFMETFATYGQVEDGWPKPFIVSETGANDWHSEENGPRYPSRHPKAGAFDRILRAHVAVADRFMQHALIFADFGLFNEPADWSRVRETLPVRPYANGDPPRLATFRRLALAYATHGAPLETEVLNAGELANRLVLVRAVDTAAIPGQAGSRATSRKVLVNLVNFEDAPARVAVRVTLPGKGAYGVLRVGDGMDAASAFRELGMRAADPAMAFDERLGPGEGVQFILTPPEGAAAPYAPMGVTAAAGARGGVGLAWRASAGAAAYTVERRTGEGAYAPAASDVRACAFTDALDGVSNGTRLAYRVVAQGAGGTVSKPSYAAVWTAGTPPEPAPPEVTAGDGCVTIRAGGPPREDARLVFARVTPDGRETRLPPVREGAAECVDTGVTNDLPYRYCVRAVNAYGASGAAMSRTVIPFAPVGTPGALGVFGLGRRAVVEFMEAEGADLYQVERSEDGGDFLPCGGWTGETTLLDEAVRPGTAYRYRVRAKREQAAGKPTEPVAAMFEEGVAPEGWTDAGVGSGEGKGGCLAAADGSLFAVTGGGHDVWAGKDGLRFVYKTVEGDAALTVRVRHFDVTHPYMKVGVMARLDAAEDSPMALVACTPQAVVFNGRERRGGECGQRGARRVAWLRLERKGAALTGYASPDGTLWEKVGEAPCPVADGAPLLMGLAVCSHSPRLSTAFFDRVDWQRVQSQAQERAQRP
jgi:hypothetical protein